MSVMVCTEDRLPDWRAGGGFVARRARKWAACERAERLSTASPELDFPVVGLTLPSCKQAL